MRERIRKWVPPVARAQDHRWLSTLNAWAHRPAVRAWARAMARAGSLEGCLLLWGALALFNPQAGLRLLLAGSIGLILFKAIKRFLRRPRPFESLGHIIAHAVPPDQFSFPSGHALHASALAVVLAVYWPMLWPVSIIWALSMAISRVMLGLHYPSDVILGSALGALVAAGVCLAW